MRRLPEKRNLANTRSVYADTSITSYVDPNRTDPIRSDPQSKSKQRYTNKNKKSYKNR